MKVATLSWAMEALLLLENLDEEVVVNIELMTDEESVVFHYVNGEVTAKELESSAYSDWDAGEFEETETGDCAR